MFSFQPTLNLHLCLAVAVFWF